MRSVFSLAFSSYFLLAYNAAFACPAHVFQIEWSNPLRPGETLLERAKTEGFAVEADLATRNDVLTQFSDWNDLLNKGATCPYAPEDITFAGQEHIFSHDLLKPATHGTSKGHTIIVEDLTVVPGLKQFAVGGKIDPRLKVFGYEGIAGLATLKGHGGLWDRGNPGMTDYERRNFQSLKGLFPINVASFLSDRERDRFKDAEQVFKDNSASLSARQAASTYLFEVITHVRAKESGIPVILLDLLQKAVYSAASRRYIPLDFLTGRHTHSQIRAYIERLRKRLDELKFPRDAAVNKMFIASLKNYLAASDLLNETHLLGYQEGLFPAISSPQGGYDFNRNAVPASKGAGTYIDVLRITGRANEYNAMGVRDRVFSNGEVLGPLHSELLAHRLSGRKVGIVVVKPQDDSQGAKVYHVRRPNGEGWPITLEPAFQPEHLSGPGFAFNSNTVFTSVDIEESSNILGFEKPKPEGSRVKEAVADIAQKHRAALLPGVFGVDYYDFKSYAHYLDYGLGFLDYQLAVLEHVLLVSGVQF